MSMVEGLGKYKIMPWKINFTLKLLTCFLNRFYVHTIKDVYKKKAF